MKKISSEFKFTTSVRIIANTKRCPKCKTPIEKTMGVIICHANAGSNFAGYVKEISLFVVMVSIARKFRNFKSYLEIFFFLTKELFRDEMQRNHAKNNLDRYTYYHQGWTNNEISRKKSGTYFGNFIVKDVLKHIVECRKIFSNGVMYMDTIFPRMKMLRLSFFFFFFITSNPRHSSSCFGQISKNSITCSILSSCDYFGQIWYEIYNWLGVVSATPARVNDHLLLFRSLCGFSKNICSAFYLILFSCIWIIWCDRNTRVFQQKGIQSFNL